MKIKPIESVLHDWVHTLPFQMQALLMTGMRGPDGQTKHNPAKEIVRFLRGAVCKPAGDWDGRNNNDFMWGDYTFFMDSATRFFEDPDGYPHHFIMHLIHCAEVIGYRHPSGEIASHWHWFYTYACKALHMHIETHEQMNDRLNDFGCLPAEDSTTPVPHPGETPQKDWVFDYLRKEAEQQIPRMQALGINTDDQFFEQSVNALLMMLEKPKEAVPAQQGEVPEEVMQWIYDWMERGIPMPSQRKVAETIAVAMYHRDQEQIKVLQSQIAEYRHALEHRKA